MGRKTAIIVGAVLGAAYFVFGVAFITGDTDVMSWPPSYKAFLFFGTPLAASLGILITQLIYDD